MGTGPSKSSKATTEPARPAPTRRAEHRALVEAILDRQLDEAATLGKVEAQAAQVAAIVLRGARALVAKAAAGKASRDQARRAFVALYKALHLVELARIAPEILAVLAPAIERELQAAKGAGGGVEAIQAVEKAARELERKAKADGNEKT